MIKTRLFKTDKEVQEFRKTLDEKSRDAYDRFRRAAIEALAHSQNTYFD